VVCAWLARRYASRPVAVANERELEPVTA